MSTPKGATTLTLERAEALVLFEMLAKLEDAEQLPSRTSAEKLALLRLQGALESVLVEPFMPDYASLLDAARLDLEAQAAPSPQANAA